MIPSASIVFDDREIGVEDRVDEDDQHGLVDVLARERDRARGAVLHLLLDEHRPECRVRCAAYSSTFSLRCPVM